MVQVLDRNVELNFHGSGEDVVVCTKNDTGTVVSPGVVLSIHAPNESQVLTVGTGDDLSNGGGEGKFSRGGDDLLLVASLSQLAKGGVFAPGIDLPVFSEQNLAGQAKLQVCHLRL